MKDDLGDRMKGYEALHDMRFDGEKPIISRLDGRAFSRLTSRLQRPYDDAFMNNMNAVAAKLLHDSGALIAYAQSDEITLVFQKKRPESQIFFGGRVQKLASVLASIATCEFLTNLREMHTSRLDYITEESRQVNFDCRVCEVPTQDEAANMVLWRVQDAKRNAIQSIARSVYSHNELHKVSVSGMIYMLKADHGEDIINRNSTAFRFGRFFRPVKDYGVFLDGSIALETTIDFTEFSHADRVEYIFRDVGVFDENLEGRDSIAQEFAKFFIPGV